MSHVLTGCRPETGVNHPSLGAVISKELGRRRGAPPYLAVHGSSFAAALGYLGAGYLEPHHAPLALDGSPADPAFRVRDMALPQEAAVERAVWQTRADSPNLHPALDLTREPERTREAYGNSSLGRKCLLARRLVEAGARFVAVDEDGWDHHFRAFDALKNRLPAFDQAVAALIADLGDRGLLGSTMVVFLTEFGRSPRINGEAGREHHPGVFSSFLAGGGIRGGQVIGASDARGESPAAQPVTPEDLFRTIYAQLGIAPQKKYTQTALGRPMPILAGGQLVRGLV
jgi:arylsulfatase A-like enzyme